MSGLVPEMAQSLGEAIRCAREFRRMTLRALARTVGISAPFLSDIEHDRRNTDKLPEIAEALGIELAYLRRLDTRKAPERCVLRRILDLESRVDDLERAMRAVGEPQTSKERDDG